MSKKCIMGIICIFLFNHAFSQKDSTGGKWIKIRSIEYNHTADEWMREPSKEQRMGPLYIHDTIYVDSFKVGILLYLSTLLKKYTSHPKTKKEIISIDTSFFTIISMKWRLVHLKKDKVKRRRKTLEEYGGDEKAYKTQCPLDTIPGIIVYHRNNMKLENMYENGIWVGCYPHYVSSGSQIFIPGKELWTIKNESGKLRTKGGYHGRFITDEKKVIQNWQVYMLITKFNYEGDKSVLTSDSITNFLKK